MEQAEQWGVVLVYTNSEDGTTKLGVYLCKDNLPSVESVVVDPNNLMGPNVFTLRALAAYSKMGVPKECVDTLEALPGFPAAWEHIEPTFIHDRATVENMIVASKKANVKIVYCSIQPMKNLSGAD